MAAADCTIDGACPTWHRQFTTSTSSTLKSSPPSKRLHCRCREPSPSMNDVEQQRLNYRHLQELLFAAAMAASTANVRKYQQSHRGQSSQHQYHYQLQQQQPQYNSYYQVLPDMRVLKCSRAGNDRSMDSWPLWRHTMVGEYVYFPSENKWMFVNVNVQMESQADDEQQQQQQQYQQSHQHYYQQHQQTSGVGSLPPPAKMPRLRFCAHRSHTPSQNFNEVVQREPIRDHWPVLRDKLLLLQCQCSDRLREESADDHTQQRHHLHHHQQQQQQQQQQQKQLQQSQEHLQQKIQVGCTRRRRYRRRLLNGGIGISFKSGHEDEHRQQL